MSRSDEIRENKDRENVERDALDQVEHAHALAGVEQARRLGVGTERR